MGTTQPIREERELERFMEYYKVTAPNPRNQALITLGLYTALRISDVLVLKWSDIYDFNQKCYYSHLFIREKKTGKHTVIALNPHVKDDLECLKKVREKALPQDYIFTKNTDYTRPLCRSSAFRIIKRAAAESLHREHISCHSLRKTFGYHAWKQGTPPALLMDIYNHSSYQITKKYLGIAQDERDAVFYGIEF